MTIRARHIYEFDNCLFDVEEQLLLVDESPVHLDPKEFDLLTYMVKNSGRVLEYDELLAAVWKDTYVEEGRLTQVVSSLRPKIGRSSIENVRGRGYRFNARVIDKSSIPDEACPWVGLMSFDERHAAYFFGRDKEIEDIISRLKKEQFLAIIGSSGRGKSSIVAAGLVPLLRKNATSTDDAWRIRLIRPTHSPLRELAISVLELSGASRSAEAILNLTERLQSNPSTLSDQVTARSTAPNEPVLLVIDQFEELFSPFVQANERDGFINNLLTAVSSPSSNVFVVVTIRTDFLQAIEANQALWRLFSDHHHFVRRFSREDLRRSIEGPAAAVDLEIENTLVDEILDDLGTGSGSLPLLSHTMAELFKLRDGLKLNFNAYRAIGKVRGAIAHHAGSVFASLSSHDKAIARRVLIRLIDVGLTSRGDVGRRVAIDDLILDSSEYDDVWRVVRTLSDKRLLTIGTEGDTLDSPSSTRRVWVEFAHVALIQHWPLLAKWLNEKRHALRTFHSLDAEAKEWLNSDRDPEFLYAGHRLEHALEERKNYEEFIEDIHSDFLEASEAAVAQSRRAERQRLRRRQQVKWLTGGVSFLLFVLALALWKWQDTKRQRDIADSLRRAADSISQLSVDPELSMLLAIESGRLTLTSQTETALRQALAASRVRTTYVGHQAQVISIDLSPDGRLLLTGGLDKAARVWDVSTGLVKKTIGNQPGGFYWAAFSPDGLSAITASRDGAARLWDLNSGEQLKEFRSHPAETQKGISVNHAVFSPDGTMVLTAEEDGVARLWDRQTGRLIRELTGHQSHLNTVAFSPDGRLIATASGDKTARVWAATNGKEIRQLKGHQESVLFVAFSPDGKRLATASRDRTARIWNVDDGTEELVISGHSLQVSSVQFSPDGKLVVTSSWDGTARVWDSQTGKEILELLGHGSAINTAIFSSDGQYVFTASGDHTVRKWALNITQHISSLSGHVGAVFGVAFSPDGQEIVTAGADKTARVWDVRSASQLKVLPHPALVQRAVFSPDGKTIATVADDRVVRLWDVGTGELRKQLSGPNGVSHSIQFSPDGSKIVTANADGVVRIWDLASNKLSLLTPTCITRLGKSSRSPSEIALCNKGLAQFEFKQCAPTANHVSDFHALRT